MSRSLSRSLEHKKAFMDRVVEDPIVETEEWEGGGQEAVRGSVQVDILPPRVPPQEASLSSRLLRPPSVNDPTSPWSSSSSAPTTLSIVGTGMTVPFSGAGSTSTFGSSSSSSNIDPGQWVSTSERTKAFLGLLKQLEISKALNRSQIDKIIDTLENYRPPPVSSSSFSASASSSSSSSKLPPEVRQFSKAAVEKTLSDMESEIQELRRLGLSAEAITRIDRLSSYVQRLRAQV